MRGAPHAHTSTGVRYPSVVSATEAAMLLNISVVAVCGLCRRGHAFPRAVKFGNAWWIAVGDVSARLQRKRGRPLTIDELLEVVVDF